MKASKLLLVRVTVKAPTFRVIDRTAGIRAAQQNKADDDRVDLHKYLISKKYPKIGQNLGAALRNYVRWHTVPWTETHRAIPIEHFEVVSPHIRTMLQAVKDAHEKTVEQYSIQRRKAEAELGDLFNEHDFPTEENLQRRFVSTIEIKEMSVAMPAQFALQLGDKDFRLGLDENEVQAIVQRAQGEFEDSAKIAAQDLVKTIMSTVSHLAESCKKYSAKSQKKFYDSNYENIAHACQLAQSFLPDDQNLSGVCEQIRELFNGGDMTTGKATAKKTKESDGAMEKAAEICGEVLTTMYDLFDAESA